MEIISLKKAQNGFIVNGSDFVSEKSSQAVIIQEWIENGGELEPEITLEEAKIAKKNEAKLFREANIALPTPKNGGAIAYNIGGEEVTFHLKISDIPLIAAICDKLSRSANGTTRSWTDIDGVRRELNLTLFRSLLDHMLARDEQEFDIYHQRVLAIDSLETIEEVNDFDLNTIPE